MTQVTIFIFITAAVQQVNTLTPFGAPLGNAGMNVNSMIQTTIGSYMEDRLNEYAEGTKEGDRRRREFHPSGLASYMHR